MDSRGLRYFIGFIVVIGLLIFLIVLIFGGSDPKKVPSSSRTLASYANDNSEVSMVIDGPINSAEEHRQVVVKIDRTRVLYEVRKGYNGETIKSERFDNSQASYSTFLQALEKAKFTQGDVDNMQADERGYCPLGRRYIFRLESSGKTVQRFWATSCGKPKTFLGDLGTNVTLFQKQVPGYYDLVDDVDL